MLSAVGICAVLFVSMHQETPWQYDKKGMSSSEKYQSGKRAPFRTLLNAGSRTVKHIQRWQYLTKRAPNLQRLQYLFEEKADREWKEKYPEGDRPASPVARDQHEEPICWMFAAASLLRTKQRDPIPHKTLVDEMKKIDRELRGFWKEFKRQYDVNKVQGMAYWMESEWWKLSQSPVFKEMEERSPHSPDDWTVEIFRKYDHEKAQTYTLVLQHFWNSHGFSYSERIHWTHHQESKIKEMLQRERAMITVGGPSLGRMLTQLTNLKKDDCHAFLLDTFDVKTGEYILKNSHGPTGGAPGAKDGKIRIPEELFNELEYDVTFIGETHLTHTPLENGWMWAVATLSQTKEGKHNPLQDIVAEVQEQWYTFVAFLTESKLIKRESGHWSSEQERYWRNTGWWYFDPNKSRKKQIDVTDKEDCLNLQFSFHCFLSAA